MSKVPRSNPFAEGKTAIKTELADGAGPGMIERKCQLTVLSGTQKGKVVEVGASRFTVGKGEAANLVLPDATVSREHFVIEAREGAFVIRDLASTNGTWIEELRIKEAYLRPGMEVRAGDVELRFEPVYRAVDVRPSDEEKFGKLVGRSVRMRQVFTLLERVAKSDATVVLMGETGSGKSAVARAIHDGSPRSSGPFVTVDCGAIAETLIESELFGHERGAFTGANQTRKGALEQAQGGTLFIDELVDLRSDLQPRLLRVLEEREVKRVGSNAAIALDVRIIAASRHDLWRAVQAGQFREDLYFRLAVFSIPLPPLRERPEDIPLLAAAFARAAPQGEELLKRLTPEVQMRLAKHPFYGNVRELRNVIDRAIALGGDPLEALGSLNSVVSAPPSASMATQEGAPLSSEAPALPSVSMAMPGLAAPPHAAAPAFESPPETPAQVELPALDADGSAFVTDVDWEAPFKEAKEQLLDVFEANYLRRLIDRSPGLSASALAKAAKIDRKHLYTLAKKHDVDLAANKDAPAADDES